MNQSTFNYNGESFKRVSKATAKRLFLDGKRIGMIANRLNPFSPWNIPMYATSMDMRKEYYIDDESPAKDFENLCNSFSYYNCNNECGRYISFYLITEGE